MGLSRLTVPAFVALSATIFNKVSQHVTRPFIDEIFHLRQCQVYCKHEFLVWDNKITTPPGLYLLGTLYSHVLHAFGIRNSCGYDALRSLNLLAGAVVLPLVLSMRKSSNFWEINVVSMPVLFTYYFLFYTDVWSTVLVIASILSVARSPTMKGAIYANLFGFGSLLFRQTNIIWIAFAGLYLVDSRRQKYTTFFKNVTSLVNQALRDLTLLSPFCANGLLFIVFVKYNGGITFGDKENHQVTMHLVQIFYCFTFMAFLTTPVWLDGSVFKNYFRFTVFGNKFMNTLITILSFGTINYVIKNYTIVHPFLLADNRHYTFYIYRKILSRPFANILLVPIYHFSTWVVARMLVKTFKMSRLSMSPLLVIGFIGSAAATLIPSPLFEPRYYIVPLVLFRIFIRPQNSATQNQRNMSEFLWYTLINMVFFIIFFNYEFTWITEPGVQRIIW